MCNVGRYTFKDKLFKNVALLSKLSNGNHRKNLSFHLVLDNFTNHLINFYIPKTK